MAMVSKFANATLSEKQVWRQKLDHDLIESAPPAVIRRYGACVGADPEIFFPTRGRGKAQPAKAICATCEVIEECGEYGMTQAFGIWGGLTAEERGKSRVGYKRPF